MLKKIDNLECKLPSTPCTIRLLTTGSFNPPHPGHIMQMYTTYTALQENGYTVNTILMSPSHDNYLKGKNYQNTERKKIPGDERIELIKNLALILQQKTLISDEFYKKLIPLSYELDQEDFVDFPDVYKELSERSPENDPLVYCCGDDLKRHLKPSITYHCVAERTKDNTSSSNPFTGISSTAVVNRDTTCIALLTRYTPEYLDYLEKNNYILENSAVGTTPKLNAELSFDSQESTPTSSQSDTTAKQKVVIAFLALFILFAVTFGLLGIVNIIGVDTLFSVFSFVAAALSSVGLLYLLYKQASIPNTLGNQNEHTSSLHIPSKPDLNANEKISKKTPPASSFQQLNGRPPPSFTTNLKGNEDTPQQQQPPIPNLFSRQALPSLGDGETSE